MPDVVKTQSELLALMVVGATGATTVQTLRDFVVSTTAGVAGGGVGPALITGATGATGPQGATGAASSVPGATGATGAAGSAGSAGATGATGPAGSAGAVGGTGATGAASTVPGATGATGPASSVPGATGATGAQGAAGAVGISWQGAWNPAITYAIGDGVSDLGSSYIAIATSLNLDPASNPGEWSLLAQKGSTGATGAQGATGAAGSAGSQGATGATGAGNTGATGPQAGATKQSITYASTIDIDLSATAAIRYVSLTGDLTLTTSNRNSARPPVLVRLLGDTVDRALVTPAWNAINAIPSTVPANKVVLINLICYGADDADIDATSMTQT